MIIRHAAPVFCSSCRRFGGSRPGTDGRSVEVPVGKGKRRDGQGDAGGGYSRGPLCPRRRARRAQYVRARRSESVLKTPSERKRDVTGEKGPFLPLLLSALNALQKLERRAIRKMPYYLVPSTVSFSTRGAKLALFSGFFREERARDRERALDGGQGPSSLPFLLRPYGPLARGKALSLLRRPVDPSDFPRCRGSVSTQKGAFICSLCVRRSHRFERAREGRRGRK